MASPFSVDNYTYLNKLLHLKEAERLEAQKKLTAAQKAALLAQLDIVRNQFATANPKDDANLKKLDRALEIINDDEKKRIYDTALLRSKKTPVQVVVETQADHSELVPLVSIDKIIALFESIKNNPKYKELLQGFSYKKVEGDPIQHIFTFPNQEAADAFVQALFDNNMAMYPSGSQDLNDGPSPKPKPSAKAPAVPDPSVPPQKTQNMKEQLLGSKGKKQQDEPLESHSNHHHHRKGKH